MRTVGRHWPRKYVGVGDYAATCALCGVRYRRSQLVAVGPSGSRLRCSGSGTSNCAKERTLEELSIGNAELNVRPVTIPIGGDGPHGSFDNNPEDYEP